MYPKLRKEETTNAATKEDIFGTNLRKKSGRGVFIDNIYKEENRRFSSILAVSRKVFHNKEIKEAANSLMDYSNRDCYYWSLFNNLNWDSTLLQCYKNGDYYDYHADHAIFTFISTFKFANHVTGGNLYIKNKAGLNTIEKYENNKLIIFPSLLEHAVAEVFVNKISNSDVPVIDSLACENRWSITHLSMIR
jgi:hypothetical protein